jgi:hypothetical protein
MKTKKLFLTFLLVDTVALTIIAQTEIPNASFENWVTIGPYENPDEWSSFNNFYNFGLPELSFKTTDTYSGNYALRLISDTVTLPPPLGTNTLDTLAGYVFLGNPDMNNPGIAYSERPISMQAYVKGTIVSGSNAYIIATLRKWNNTTYSRELVGQALYYMQSSISNYTQISVPFNYYNLTAIPDTLEIKIMAGDVGPGGLIMPGNEIFVDSISFSFPVNLIEKGKNNTNIKFFPNPLSSSSETILQLESTLGNATLTVYNCLGQQVIQITNISGNKITFQPNNLPGGVYYINLTHNSEVILVYKLIITTSNP